ncbi:MAG: ABC transporter ATP-binding protein [Acidimicrobiales bacterium]|nr:ABC transporter ATP-binding protein [Acidimicrobiales bacterium]
MRLLEIKDLQITFGGLDALSGLNFHIDKGEIVSVIGPNGAGKTTFFNAISGLVTPTDGDMFFEGESIVGLDPSTVTSLGIARTFQNVRLFPNMTILENVMVAQHCRTRQLLYGALFQTRAFKQEEREIRERAEEILGFFGHRLVGYRMDQPAFALSYANRRRLEIARAMATQPQLLLLDEPVAGMNPIETAELTALIGRLRSEWGFTIVMIEHDMKVVKDVSDRVVVLDHGVPIAQGSYDEVSNNPDVVEAYLGRPVEAR